MRTGGLRAALLVVCLALTVGSQFQAKALVTLFSTPLLAAWVLCLCLAVIDGVQWAVIGYSKQEHTNIVNNRSSLWIMLLHLVDISTYFISMNYVSLRTMALVQPLLLTVWQILSTGPPAAYIQASFAFCGGLAAFLVETLQSNHIQFALRDIFTAMTCAFANLYLHHYAQRFVDRAQNLKLELYASGSLVALLAPLAWLEYSSIYLPDVNVSDTLWTLAVAAALWIGYRRCGTYLSSFSPKNTAEFLIAASLLIILLVTYPYISTLTAISFVLFSKAAYISSVDIAEEPKKSVKKAEIAPVVVLGSILLLGQCTVIVLSTSAFTTIELNPTGGLGGLTPLKVDPEYEMNRFICLSKVRETIVREVGSRIKDGEPLSFMDFPMHWNLGDLLIWQGTQHVIEIRGQFPIVADTFMDRNITVASSRIKKGVFLLQGGGNFGDLWRDNANFRINVTKRVKTNDIIFLPQSIHYNRVAMMQKDNETFQANSRLLFMFRDYPSIEYSRKNFVGIPTIYVPDMALAMGPQTPNASPVVDIVLLLRTDKENILAKDDRIAGLKMLETSNVTFEVWDFPVGGFPIKMMPDNKTAVYNYTQIYPKQLSKLRANNRQAQLGLRIQMANNLFSRGRVVVTDRLHASIMSTLMGKPLVYLDNSYKKITNVRGALAKEFPECSDTNLHARHTRTLLEATTLALAILDGSVKI